ncbi:hypothetical protein TNCV_1788851 [Trichonephila clavipes]|nr:hypothetical protein TNCV_1788851 [Trichonephila clavipes]
MGLSQADAARRLNVSRSVVHRLWNQYQTEASVSRIHVLFQANHELKHLQETVLSYFRPEGEGFLCRNLLQTTL